MKIKGSKVLIPDEQVRPDADNGSKVLIPMDAHEDDGDEPLEKRHAVEVENPTDGLITFIDIPCIIKEQLGDEQVQKLLELAKGRAKKGSMKDKDAQDAQGICKVAGVVVKRVPDEVGNIVSKVVVPKTLQGMVVKQAHEMSHAGFDGTYNTLRKYHWFRGMKEAVENCVKRCEVCIAVKGRKLVDEKLAPDVRPIALNDRWHIDGLQLPPAKGYDHLMVAVDAATKYVILEKSAGETAQAASDILMDIACRFGRPKEVTTDQGRAFVSELFLETCRMLFVKYKPVGVKQPQANGMVERVNRTIIQIATSVCKGKGDQWPDWVRQIEFAINTRISSVTKFSPYELVFGRRPPGPIYMDVITEQDRQEGTISEQVEKLSQQIKIRQELAHQNQMEAAEKQRSYHDAHAEAHTFKEGDKVWLYKKSSVEKGITSKLRYRWAGPFKIGRVIGPVTFTLETAEGKPLPGTYHANVLYNVTQMIDAPNGEADDRSAI